MSEPDPKEYLSDLLSDVARAERRNLLIASTLGVLVSQAGLVPNQISALGVGFTAPEKNAFLVVLALVVGYFIIAFSIYAIADFFLWRKRYYDYRVAAERLNQNWTQEKQEDYDELHSVVTPIRWYYEKSPWVAKSRAVFEFVVPIAVGLSSICMLFLKVWCP